ncbi:chitobiase/beta-hexosaminidase C-terminal domain-containing protein [Sporolactobacillus sp. CPB3-1]|uniref:Chitobiase/beta-hexosaminidase C-terminal domain-containing protein n=1 Tax=Sporolactobacillus mangiferae TaxID=2940498 RepID=A0ABT0MAR9_9BACL|nr:chitobiase/beta-hexosaminidase C-terminal domain-containing protein [Sporolactobacillus mangiferae]MCL1631959.1 chitobiase/beta-hexosaminidase C-terminal domain-containing protein [Sporolactobacillus mangiferae]
MLKRHLFTTSLLGFSLLLGTFPSSLGEVHAKAQQADSSTIVVDNATGTDQNGKAMSGPGLNNTDVDGYWYSIGASQISASAGGQTLYLYRGKDWRNKKQFAKIADPETSYRKADGTVIRPFANSKLERIDFERSPTGKYVIWMHWELKSTYNASHVVVLSANKVTGPYKVVADHSRPGASRNVGAKGQAGTTDKKAAMGDRVGQLRSDFNTKNAAGEYDGSPEVPVTGKDYPAYVQSYPEPTGPKSTSYDPDKPTKPVSSDMYGTSEGGNWWTFNFNDLKDSWNLKAVAVRMTPYDQSAYDAAVAKGLKPSASGYIVRYPAAKADPTKAAGISAQNYGGSAKTAYDPNTKDQTKAVLGPMAKSSVYTQSYTKTSNDNDQRQSLKAPLISPRIDENTGVNKDSKSVVVNQGDRVYVTSDVDLGKYKVMVTTDGSDPRTSKTAWQWDNRYNVPDVPIKDGMTIKAVATDLAGNKFSRVSTSTFTVAKAGTKESADVPVFQPVANFKSGKYQVTDTASMFGYKELRVLEPTYNAEVYYTMDGGDPTPPRYGQNIGFGSRDFTIFNDSQKSGGNGKSYFITAQDNIYTRVWQLNADMTNVVSAKEHDIDIAKHREAPQVIRGPHGKYLYLLTSGQSGWYKNQAMYQRTTSPALGMSAKRDQYGYRNGGSSWTPLQPFADATTYNSQVGGVWNFGTKDKPVYLFNGSRWIANDLAGSTTIWLPLTINDKAKGPGAETGKTVTVGTNSTGTKITVPTYKPAPGLVSVKYFQKTYINPSKGTVVGGDGTDEQIKIQTSSGKPEKFDPYNHTPRVIAIQSVGSFTQIGKASPSKKIGDNWETIANSALEKQGIVHRYDVGEAFNGIDWDVDNYDGTEQAYKGQNGKFYITLDLGQKRKLTNVALSFKSVGGSDNAHRYTILGSNDNKNWTTLVNNNQNNIPGFQAHDLTGNTYRYLKFQNNQSFDIVHNKDADWARGLYEMTVRAEKTIPLKTADLEKAVTEGETLLGLESHFTAASFAAFKDQYTKASALLDELRHEGQQTKHTQAEVDKAAKDLNAAINGLQGIGSSQTGIKVDFADLSDAVQAGKTSLTETKQAEINTAKEVEAVAQNATVSVKRSLKNVKAQTPSSKLIKAVANGQKVLSKVADPSTTQSDINTALKAIKEARK